MALKAGEVKIITDAIPRAQAIQFEYYPNKTAKISLKGTRICLPLALFRMNGNYYFFGYFLGGTSYSGGVGYRLYFQKNMYNVQNVSVGLNFSKIQKIKLFSKINKIKLLITKKED